MSAPTPVYQVKVTHSDEQRTYDLMFFQPDGSPHYQNDYSRLGREMRLAPVKNGVKIMAVDKAYGDEPEKVESMTVHTKDFVRLESLATYLRVNDIRAGNGKNSNWFQGWSGRLGLPRMYGYTNDYNAVPVDIKVNNKKDFYWLAILPTNRYQPQYTGPKNRVGHSLLSSGVCWDAVFADMRLLREGGSWDSLNRELLRGPSQRGGLQEALLGRRSGIRSAA